MSDLPEDFEIGLAIEADIPAMIWADKAASKLFEPTGLIEPEGLGDHVPSSVFVDEIPNETVFAARRNDGHAVGFAITRPRGKGLYLDQVSVHPDYGRNGIGRALVLRVLREAEARRLPHVSLSTFRDLAWNGPFYASMGFAELPREKYESYMYEIEDAQRKYMDVGKRCFMRRRVRRTLFGVRKPL